MKFGRFSFSHLEIARYDLEVCHMTLLVYPPCRVPYSVMLLTILFNIIFTSYGLQFSEGTVLHIQGHLTLTLMSASLEGLITFGLQVKAFAP